ncbi:MAG: Crp/Fnr family transcriptional regulator, partial [Acidobacteria bacterium]|nr:Crp/Fnr family transcriptional regulator [Acidobacteriota bacterium]
MSLWSLLLLPSAVFITGDHHARRLPISEQPRPPNENRILSALPREDYDRLAPHLKPVSMPRGEVLYHTGAHIEYVYFPVKSMISLVSRMSDGANVEVGVTGFEGMVGLPFLLGSEKSPHECMVQIPDGALRARADVIKSEFKRGGALQDLLHRYTQSLLVMTSQAAACNRAHSVGERLARWLLMTHDRCV